MTLKNAIVRAGCALALAAAVSPAAAANGGPMPAPIVFFDIAGPDTAAQSAFYRKVFGWDAGQDGRFSVRAASPLPGTLRADPAEKVLYIGVDDVTATLAQVRAHGGKVVQPRFEVKGVVALGLFTDPAGNRMGLVELKDGRPKVP